MKLYTLGRRDFVHLAALGGAAAALPRWLRAGILESELSLVGDLGIDPSARAFTARTDPVRVRGIVEAGGQGLGGVSVSDGLSVVRTSGGGPPKSRCGAGAAWRVLLLLCRPYQISLASAILLGN